MNAEAEQGGVSTSVGQLTRGVDTYMNKPKVEFCNMQISSHQYLGKVFQILQKKLGITENSSNFGIEAIKDQCTEVVIVHVFGNDSRHSSWTGLHREFGRIQEHELRGNSEFIRYHSEIDVETVCHGTRPHEHNT